jgi:phosphohistidine phosphatase
MNIKNLILIRHAKSNWDSFVQDIERPLAQRGIEDITLVAKESIKFLPAKKLMIFSSPAKRARETALIFATTILHPSDSIFFSADLYTFNENKLEKYVESIDNDYDNVILFGHNDAITNFVNKFGTIFIANVPTSGLVWLQFETDNWGKLEKGKTIKVMFPKNLK